MDGELTMSTTGKGSDINWGTINWKWGEDNKPTNIEFSPLVDTIEQLSLNAKSMIARIRSKRSAMSIADMFDLQMAMNKLSQFSEMSTSVVAGINSAIASVNRNLKG
jgi:hypothetical protein